MTTALNAKGHKEKNLPQDTIEVVAQIPLTSAPVQHFLETQHYRRSYLYAESSGGKTITLIDVTDIGKPVVLSVLSSSPGVKNLVTAAGTAALMSENLTSSAESADGQTVRIMSFANLQHPEVIREFPDVSAISRDDRRGLIFLADPQGVWILREKLAIDPDFEREWEHMALDNR